jgi:LacI family transcriptional regulator, galactose operon repressor
VIVEVAKLAGVSPSTASRVLSNSTYRVSAETRARVLEAAKSLDFVPNALARGLHESHLPVVGVLVHDLADPYFAEIARGVEDAACASGHLVVVASSDRIIEREISYARLLRSMRAEAIVFAGSGTDDETYTHETRRHANAVEAYGGAVVHLSPHARGKADIGYDNHGPMIELVAALAGLGHRRIAYLAGPANLFVARQRLAGFQDGIAAAGLEHDERLIVEADLTAAAGADGIDRLLARDTGASAVVCVNDLAAFGALRRAAELGLRVPRDISIAGFDDISVAAQMAPSLTTIRVPLHELGARAFERVVKVLAGQRPRRVTLPTEVVLRGSTGRHRG